MRFFAWLGAFLVIIAVSDSTAFAYTYVPTEQDRGELRTCAAAAGPNTIAVDCVMPTISRISSAKMSELNAPVSPARPSQVFVMIKSAGMLCGMGSNMAQPPTPSAKDCLNVEAQKVSEAIALGLRDALKTITAKAP